MGSTKGALCGYVALWLCGSVATYLCGYMAMLLWVQRAHFQLNSFLTELDMISLHGIVDASGFHRTIEKYITDNAKTDTETQRIAH